MIRGPISTVIVGMLVLAGVLVWVKGPDSVLEMLPERLVQGLQGGAAGTFDSAVKGSGDKAADFLADDGQGLSAHGPIAALEGNRPVFIADVLSGHTTRVENAIPAEITTIRPISGCRLTPPQPGSVIGHATAGRTDLGLALLTYDDADLARAVQGLVDGYRATGSAAVTVPSDLSYTAYDVAVTESKAPVYLVLEASSGNLIWNIHLAPGAQVERVILLGGAQVGVANLDPVVPVEVLPGAAMADCGIRPAYSLNPGHLFFQSVASGAISKDAAETKLAAIKEAVAAYDTWFRDSFGVLAEPTRAGFDSGTVSVVGPVPDSGEGRAVYASLDGARIRMTQDIYFEIAGQVAPGEDFASRVKAIATTFAGGDLATLRQGVSF